MSLATEFSGLLSTGVPRSDRTLTWLTGWLAANGTGNWVRGSGLVQPFCATFPESADCIARCVSVDLERMPSRHESFFVVRALALSYDLLAWHCVGCVVQLAHVMRGMPLDVVYDGEQVGDVPDQTYSNAKAKRLLGWVPSDDIYIGVLYQGVARG
jgi:hypothetical protein